MCGRFSITHITEQELEQRFDVKSFPTDMKPNFNVAPTMNSPVVINTSQKEVNMLRWGLVPYWAKDIKIGYKMINARAETLAEKASFKKPLASQRCLVIADGFYEWKKAGKVPYRITRKDNELFSFAGLWDVWKAPEGNMLRTFTIITCPPNDLMKPLHDRMPVILPRKAEKQWLSEISTEEAQQLLRPFPDKELKAFQISDLVNSPKNNNKEIIQPVKSLADFG